MKQLITYLLLFVFLPFINYSQGITFKGLVKTSDNKILSDIIISKKYNNKEAEISTILSNKFSVTLSDTLNLESISFSYLGYEPVAIKVSNALLFIRNNINIDYVVVLKTKNINLNPVVVTDKHPFYQNENATVFDYEIMPNGNLLLVMERKIFLVNPKDSILKTVPNISGIDEVVKACSGRIFLRNRTLLYPTYINDTTLLISDNPVEINSSMKQINELVACDTAVKIKESVGVHNQQVVYKLQSFSDPSSELNFYVALNKEQMKQAIKEKKRIDKYDSLAALEQLPTMMTAKSETNMSNGGKGSTQSFYDEFFIYVWPEDHKEWKYDFFTSKKLYVPIFLHHDSIYVFDHVINKVTVFAYNKIKDTIKINTILKDSITYNKKKGWQKAIIQDSYTGEFFTAYRNDKLVLNNILLFDTKKQISIILPKEHLFVSRIKIYNHTVYYLWKDKSNQASSRTLYKVAAE